jgi:hypothetical protein
LQASSRYSRGGHIGGYKPTLTRVVAHAVGCKTSWTDLLCPRALQAGVWFDRDWLGTKDPADTVQFGFEQAVVWRVCGWSTAWDPRDQLWQDR